MLLFLQTESEILKVIPTTLAEIEPLILNLSFKLSVYKLGHLFGIEIERPHMSVLFWYDSMSENKLPGAKLQITVAPEIPILYWKRKTIGSIAFAFQ